MKFEYILVIFVVNTKIRVANSCGGVRKLLSGYSSLEIQIPIVRVFYCPPGLRFH
jgi:hypothetical protein